MDLFPCVSTSMEETARAKSEDREGGAPLSKQWVGPARRTSLQMPPGTRHPGVWPTHCSQKKKTSVEQVEPLTSRTLSPAPETLTRKFSRVNSVVPGHTPAATPRLPRHPELPPLIISELTAPKLADYLEKPRLVNAGASRRSSQAEEPDSLTQELSRLSSYYNQTFLNGCDTCDSMSHKNPVSVLNPGSNRGM